MAESPGTVHHTDISTDARTHYHRRLTEVYYILECERTRGHRARWRDCLGQAGQLHPDSTAVRHRAIGPMQVLVIVQPKFDPADEWFD